MSFSRNNLSLVLCQLSPEEIGGHEVTGEKRRDEREMCVCVCEREGEGEKYNDIFIELWI